MRGVEREVEVGGASLAGKAEAGSSALLPQRLSPLATVRTPLFLPYSNPPCSFLLLSPSRTQTTLPSSCSLSNSFLSSPSISIYSTNLRYKRLRERNFVQSENSVS